MRVFYHNNNFQTPASFPCFCSAILSVAVELPSESCHSVPVSDTISRHGNVQLNKMTGVIHPSKESYFITALLKIAYMWDTDSSWFYYYFKILFTCPRVGSSHHLPFPYTLERHSCGVSPPGFESHPILYKFMILSKTSSLWDSVSSS